MVITASNVRTFGQQIYQTLAQVPAVYMREQLPESVIPRAILALDQLEYKKGIVGNTIGVQGGVTYSAEGTKLESALSTKTFKLANVQGGLTYGPNEMALNGAQLASIKRSQLEYLANQAIVSAWKGVYQNGFIGGIGNGAKATNGILDDASSVTNLDGTNSALTTAGDVFKALTKMLFSIPFRIRQGREVHLGMTSHFWQIANSTTYTSATSGLSEWEQFMAKHGPSAPLGMRVMPENVHISDEIFLGQADTLNTNDRLAVWVADPNVVELAVSRGFGPMAPPVTNTIGENNETWAVRLAGCVHDANGVQYSEAITWA